MFLHQPADTDETARIFKKDQDDRGYVMNLSRLWSWRPDVFEAFASLRTQLTSKSSLSQRDLAVLVCATAAQLGDSYCALAWGKQLAAASDPAVAAAVIRDANSGPTTPRDKALSAWARRIVEDPNSTSSKDVEALRAAGLSELEIFEATTFIAFRLAFSTVNDALGALPDSQVRDAAPPAVQGAVTFGRPVAPIDRS